jgi:hypothetical protein
VKVEGTTWETLQGSMGGVDYLVIHEMGGVIRGHGKLLTIPLPAALNSQGLPIRGIRQWENTFIARSHAGNIIVFQRRLNEVVPLYVLVPQVRIRPRLGMGKELKDQMPYFLNRAVDLVVRDFQIQMGMI